MPGQQVDFGATATDYARHRRSFPERFFDRLADFGIGRAGQRVLDLGTGTGALGRELERRGSTVFGLDRSTPLLAEARRLDREAGLDSRYVRGRAEWAPFADASFDVVTAGTCWHWFERDRAAAEARRLLRPGGLLAMAWLEWVALPGEVVDITEELIERHNPSWNLRGISAITSRWFKDTARVGFIDLESFSFDFHIPYSQEDWRGRIRASAGVGATLTPEAVARFDAELAALLSGRFPDPLLQVRHRVFALVARAP